MTPPSSPRSARAWRLLAAAVAVALLAAAIALALREGRGAATVRPALAAATATDWALLAGSTLASLAATAGVFSVLMRRHGRVGLLEMQALIAAAALLNLLPLRPGFAGRLAWHRARNDIPLLASARVSVEALALGVGVSALVAASALAAHRIHAPPAGAALAAPALLAALALPRWRGRRLALAGLLRSAEVLLLAVRYAVAFRLLGAPLEASGALGLACVATIAQMVPLFGAGLGVREWAIGLLAPSLVGVPLALGVTADLLNRSVEIVVLCAAGAAGLAALARMRSTPAPAEPA